ncbi:MAG: Zn-ribbon protein [Acidimicrobiales bacterium]|nr:Zn-ribbon protein [Acidimicrobiales bacterium]
MTVGVLEQLLLVQGHDTHIDQLRHRVETLPERAQLVDAQAARAGLAAQEDDVRSRRDALSREQRSLEDEVASLTDKRQGVEATMYGGTVSNPRELQAMQEEMAALGRRMGQLEDRIIELMEEIEPLDRELVELGTGIATQEHEVARLTREVAEQEQSISAELEVEGAARSASVEGIPAALLAEYESLRAGSGGIAVARLAGNQCGGCHLTLSAVEFARIRKLPPDEVAHCEECGRLLVH